MDILLVIIFVVIGLIKIFASAAQKMSNQQAPAPSSPRQGGMGEVFNMSEVDDALLDDVDVEGDDAPEYFSYENPAAKVDPISPVQSESAPVGGAENAADSDAEPFDLRKAVVYQTILERVC